MANKSFIRAASIGLLTVCLNVDAALLSEDWKTSGDNLITYDNVSGLRWLDLTETYSLAFTEVSGQFGSGADFEGFRYATNAEVIDLWTNFSIDLSFGAPTSTAGYESNVQTAAELLGNTWNLYAFWDYPFGVSGITANTTGSGHDALGAYLSEWGGTIETVGTTTIDDSLPGIAPYGSYLVMASPVPVPAAVWLFASGLIGLIGVARRK